MSDVASQYELTQVVPTDDVLEKYRECFAKNGTERSIGNLKWLHQQNVANTHMIYYAIEKSSGDIAGIYTVIPNLVRISNKVFPGLQSVDTLTDENHRGKGLFIKLARQLYGDAAKNGIELVYGFPNGNSAPGFFKKLEWKSFGEAPFLIKPLRITYFLKKLFNRTPSPQSQNSNHPIDAPQMMMMKKDAQLRLIDTFGQEYDLLWEKAAQTMTVTVDRSSKYMNWRYVNKPGEVYYRYGLYDVSNQLLGIAVFSLKSKHGGLIGYLMELIFDPADAAAGKSLLKLISGILKKNGADCILAWCLPHSYNYAAYKKTGFYILPDKVKPQKLYWGVRALQSLQSKKIENPESWYISYSDSDTV